jgi:hypothetical protein
MTAFLRSFLCFALLLAAAPAVARADDDVTFMQTLEDVPLMPGLHELADQAVVFDQPDGRIVEVTAVADGLAPGAGSATITGFYAQTLPQLGWTADGPGAWVREKERLTMQFGAATGGPAAVRFMVQPR